jgi:hypothetical protein
MGFTCPILGLSLLEKVKGVVVTWVVTLKG